ncbi:hypothetical protein BGZ83_004010 [Gryganskiella cystojenkinii]|nr:hypothetical protein BGZ83_004010 [Gryganskiella cystojenkinii]
MSLRRIKKTLHRHLPLNQHANVISGSDVPCQGHPCICCLKDMTVQKDEPKRPFTTAVSSICKNTKSQNKTQKNKDRSELDPSHRMCACERMSVIALDHRRARGDNVSHRSGTAATSASTTPKDHPLSWKRFVNNQGRVQAVQQDQDVDRDEVTLTSPTEASGRLPPCYVSCFSPLDLPIDLFVYLLDFLTPGDLWRLCQVSSKMGLEVRRYMSRTQQLGFEAVKLLYRGDEEEEIWASIQDKKRSREIEKMIAASLTDAPSSSLSSSTDPLRAAAYNSPMFSSFGQASEQLQHQKQQYQALPPPQQHPYHLRVGHQHPHRTMPEPRLPVHAPPKPPLSRSETRSTYWSSQAAKLLNLLVADTAFAPVLKENPVKNIIRDINEIEENEEDDDEAHVLRSIGPIARRNGLVPSGSSSCESPSSSSPSTAFLTPDQVALLLKQNTNVSGSIHWSPILAPYSPLKTVVLPLDRLRSIINLLFDPNLVDLHHRRAVINCARYVTAGVEDGFGDHSKTDNPVDAVFAVKLAKDCSVSLEPYLHMVTAVTATATTTGDSLFQSNSSSNIVSAAINTSCANPTILDVVHPPARFTNYFQIMLWHRCLSDLVALYNKIQGQHASRHSATDLAKTAALPSFKVSTGSWSNRKLPWNASSATLVDPSNSYNRDAGNSGRSCSHCASTLETVQLTSQYPYNGIPSSVRFRFRQAFHKLCTISSPQNRRHCLRHQQTIIDLSSSSTTSSTSNLVNDVQTPPGNRGFVHVKRSNNVITMGCPHRASAAVHTEEEGYDEDKDKEDDEDEDMDSDMDMDWVEHRYYQEQEEQKLQIALEQEALIYQRYRIEERIRQDNLVKQELLSLCHMACGLFLSDDNHPFPLIRTLHQQHLLSVVTPTNATPTIMTLLRHHGPWYKGVWREGEWRRSPIQIEDEIDEISIQQHDQLEQGTHQGQGQQRSRLFSRASATRTAAATINKESSEDQGPWQKLCLAAIDFLTSESLYWGGNQTNTELSKLRATCLASSWIYHE